MKPRFRVFGRGRKFYQRDTETGERISLHTSDPEIAKKLVDAENQAAADPALGQELARAYLSKSDPLMAKRTWQDVINENQHVGAPATQERKARVFQMREFNLIRDKPFLKTVAEDSFAYSEPRKSV